MACTKWPVVMAYVGEAWDADCGSKGPQAVRQSGESNGAVTLLPLMGQKLGLIKWHFLATAETLVSERDFENQFYPRIWTPNECGAIP